MTRVLLTLEQATDLIQWAYHSPNSHGKIAVPKIKSMKVKDIARCLLKAYGKEVDIELKEIGIRPGEKLHEEMISIEEWLRTEDDTAYLITSEHTTNELWSYNSKDCLMDDTETYNFLQKSGVID